MQYQRLLVAALLSAPIAIFACAEGSSTLPPSEEGNGGSAGSEGSGGKQDPVGSTSSSSSGQSSSGMASSSGGSGGGGSSSSSASSTSTSSTSSSSSASSSSSGGTTLPCVAKAYSFDTCPSDFTTGGVNSDWQCGIPPANVGPGADHTGGGSLWATKLSGNANTCQDSTLASPAIDLSMVAGQMVFLRFWHWDQFRECTCLCTDSTSYSGGVLEVKTNGGTWTTLTPTTGYGNGTQKINCSQSGASCSSCALDDKPGFGAAGPQKAWIQSEYDISAYANASFEFRLHYASHGGYGCYPARDGWYIDDIEIGTKNLCP